MCAALCFTPPHGNSGQHYFDIVTFLPLNHILYIIVSSQFFWRTLTFSWPHSTFPISQQTKDSVFALVRLIAGATESPRDPSRGPWTCERVRTWARWVTARFLIPAWASCTLCVTDHYKSFYMMEISRGKGSEGWVQGKDSKPCSSCTLTVEAWISYEAVTLEAIYVYVIHLDLVLSHTMMYITQFLKVFLYLAAWLHG